MEYVEGVTMYTYLVDKKRRRLVTVLNIILNLTLALQALYSLGLAHGDLSVENVMIGLDGTAKLIDFEKTNTIRVPSDIDFNIRGVDVGWRASYLRPDGVGYFYLIVQILNGTGNYNESLISKLKKTS